MFLSYTDSTFSISGEVFQRGSASAKRIGADRVRITVQTQGGRRFEGLYSDFESSAGVFASQDALMTYIISFFFRNLSGGGVGDGRGIQSIALTNSVGLVDTYTITYTDATTSTYTVTNGAPGSDGAPGANGEGVPTGGTAGQVLKKNSSTDYDTIWADPDTSGGVSLDANYIAVGTGSGVTGYANFTYNNSTGEFISQFFKWSSNAGTTTLATTGRMGLGTGSTEILLGGNPNFGYKYGTLHMGVSSADTAAMADFRSSTKGVAIPEMVQADRLAMSPSARAVLVIQTDAGTDGAGLYRWSPQLGQWIFIG